MKIEVEWCRVEVGGPELNWSCALYAYVSEDESTLLYLGKADGPSSSIGKRYRADDKAGLWERMESAGARKFRLFAGAIHTKERLTRELMADIEALLIHRLQPVGNLMCKRGRGITRPGLCVKCVGHWSLPRKHFIDRG